LKYLLDTCVISELIKPERCNQIVKWIKSRKEDSLYISVLTIGEICKGISKLPDSQKKKSLRNWIDNDLKKRFGGRILEITEEIATSWGEIQAKSEKEGKKMPVIDSLIAATAIKNNLTVVTRNVKDIENSGCKSINPWAT
jgi:predicted nucleic acid-binding protein